MQQLRHVQRCLHQPDDCFRRSAQMPEHQLETWLIRGIWLFSVSKDVTPTASGSLQVHQDFRRKTNGAMVPYQKLNLIRTRSRTWYQLDCERGLTYTKFNGSLDLDHLFHALIQVSVD